MGAACGVALLVGAAAAARQATLVERRIDRKALVRLSRRPNSDERTEAMAAIRKQTLTSLAGSAAFGAGCVGAVALLFVWVP